MRAAGNDKSVRAAMLSDALDEGAEPVDIAPTPAPPAYVPEAVPAAMPAAMPDVATLIQMLAAAMNQNGALQAEAIKTALADAAVMAREPIPENKVSPGISVYSHPLGDAKHPRTQLVCPMFLGHYDENGAVTPVFEYHAQTLEEIERLKLNSLTVGTYPLERNDGVRGLCRVVEHKDDLGQPIRRVLAVPQAWLGQDQFSQVPSLKQKLTQILPAAEAAVA